MAEPEILQTRVCMKEYYMPGQLCEDGLSLANIFLYIFNTPRSVLYETVNQTSNTSYIKISSITFHALEWFIFSS